MERFTINASVVTGKYRAIKVKIGTGTNKKMYTYHATDLPAAVKTKIDAYIAAIVAELTDHSTTIDITMTHSVGVYAITMNYLANTNQEQYRIEDNAEIFTEADIAAIDAMMETRAIKRN